nr:MAG TPA: hypothetical protein [Caudoviricetes sp.]
MPQGVPRRGHCPARIKVYTEEYSTLLQACPLKLSAISL